MLSDWQNLFPSLLEERPYLRGIVGLRPVAYSGALMDDFRRKWTSVDPDVYYLAGNQSAHEYPSVRDLLGGTWVSMTCRGSSETVM